MFAKKRVTCKSVWLEHRYALIGEAIGALIRSFIGSRFVFVKVYVDIRLTCDFLLHGRARRIACIQAAYPTLKITTAEKTFFLGRESRLPAVAVLCGKKNVYSIPYSKHFVFRIEGFCSSICGTVNSEIQDFTSVCK